MDRIINVSVNGEFVRKDSKNAGVQGEANATALHITMSEDWAQFSKRIVWRDALGENPVAVLLYNAVEDLVAGKDPLTFDTPIPAEPLALAGWCSFTIEGFRDSDPTAVSIAVTDHLLVKPNDTYNTPAEPTPTQAQQLQARIDQIIPLVCNAVDELEQAEETLKQVRDTWSPGDDYVTPNIQVGNVETLPAGSAATVERDPDSSAAAPVFNFGIPKGADAHSFTPDDIGAAAATHAGQHAADGTDPITPDMIGAAGGSNLLDNWYFAEPINQRGKPEYSEKGYTIDRWHFNTAGSDLLSLQSGGVKVSSGSAASAPSIDQFLEIPSSIAGKTVTFSVKVREVGGTGGTNRGYTVFVVDGAEHPGAAAIIQDSGVFSMTTTVPSGVTSVRVRCAAYWNNYAVYEAAKLELGSTQTLAHQNEDGSWVLNDPPPDKGLELLKCITSTADAGDAYACKTIATAPVTGTYTGTGAARSIAVGGSGKVCMVWANTTYGFVNENGFVEIWSSEGLSSGSGGVTEAARPVTFVDGVLTFAASTVHPTGYTILNHEGTTYNYRVF